jgi:hypothetical protein
MTKTFLHEFKSRDQLPTRRGADTVSPLERMHHTTQEISGVSPTFSHRFQPHVEQMRAVHADTFRACATNLASLLIAGARVPFHC